MLRSLSCGLLMLVGAGAARAQDIRADSIAASPPRAFSMVETRRFAGVLALGGLAYLADDAARDALRDRANATGGVVHGLERFGYYYGDPGVAVLSVAMWGAGRLADRPVLASSGLRGMEAVAVSGAVVFVLKEVTGRARPEIAPHAKDDWNLFRGLETTGGDYQSMASGHAAVSFAFATAVTAEVARHAPRAARTVGLTTFALAALTSWQRMHEDRHWLSDVTVGGGIGVVTALAITRWHATRPDNVIDRWFLRPATFSTPRGDMAVGLTLVRAAP
jgi:membrane-associated phospholipid phosphatase